MNNNRDKKGGVPSEVTIKVMEKLTAVLFAILTFLLFLTVRLVTGGLSVEE